jgi:uracil-DNA glycosylase
VAVDMFVTVIEHMPCSSLSNHFPPGTWFELFEGEFKRPPIQKLCHFLERERAEWPGDVQPEPECVFNAFSRTPWEDVRVVILGQDPYPGRRQATGLAFGVPRDQGLTPSLRNINAELGGNLGDRTLNCWAKQGVLLLNTVLTVFGPAGPGSHARRGWECFTDVVIEKLYDEHPNKLAFLLWGKAAQATAARLSLKEKARRRLLRAPHPASVRSPNQTGFVGCGAFRDANAFLRTGKVDWSCADSEA